MSLRVLLLEDEPKVFRFIKSGIEQSGFHFAGVTDHESLHSILETHRFDVLIMDRLIGVADSLTLLPALKKKFPQLRIIILSALAETDQKVVGLEQGADDYLGKPFHIRELISRIKSLGRRSQSEPSHVIEYHDLVVKLDSQEVVRSGQSIPLSAREFKILSLLIQNPTKIYSRTELLDRIWGLDFDPESNVVEVAIARLRGRINKGQEATLIHSRRGSGYSLVMHKREVHEQA